MNPSSSQRKKGLSDFLGEIFVSNHYRTSKCKKALDIRRYYMKEKSMLRLYLRCLSRQRLRELEENNIRISCRTFVRHQGVMAGA